MRYPILAAVALCASGVLTLPAAGQQADLRYIPDSAVLAVYVQPQQLLEAPNMELMPYEVITAAGMKHLGFDPMQIQSALMLGEVVDPSQPPAAAVLLRFKQPFDRDAILPAILRDAEDVSVGQVTLKRSNMPGNPAAAIIDDKTLLIGVEAMVRKMLQQDDSPGPLRSIIAANAESHLACVYLTLEPVRPLVNAAMAQALPIL